MKVSVVILNWNGESLLRSYIPNVVANTPGKAKGVELVVADNGSTDGSLSFLRECYPEIRVFELGQNYGFAEGYNRAIKLLDTEYSVLLNSDVEVASGWLDALVSYMDEHPDVVACQPKIRSLKNPARFEHAGAAGGFIDWLGYPYCRGRIFDNVEADMGQYDAVADVFWATGACLFIRTSEYKRVGGLDARFFAHMEEIDLCWRLKSRSWRIVCIPDSVVYHLGGATLDRENPRKTFLNYRNNLLMLYKNLPLGDMFIVFLLRFFLDYLSAMVFLFSGKRKDAWAVVRARFAFWRMLPRFRSARQSNLRETTSERLSGRCPGSILFLKYVRGYRRFSEFQ
jgi:GT2 family glycosyltransferase